MSVRATWLEVIEALDPAVHDEMLRETARTIFRGPLPDEFQFLMPGFVDLGFEHLDLSPQEYGVLLRSFCSTGVAVPGTDRRMRYLYPHTVVECADGSENSTLPQTWKQAVLVLGDRCQPTWIGKTLVRTRPAAFDLTGYCDVGDGWVLG